LEVPCQFIFSIDDAKECEQLRKCIIDSLSRTCHNESPSSNVVKEIEVVEEEQGRISDKVVDNSQPKS